MIQSSQGCNHHWVVTGRSKDMNGPKTLIVDCAYCRATGIVYTKPGRERDKAREATTNYHWIDNARVETKGF